MIVVWDREGKPVNAGDPIVSSKGETWNFKYISRGPVASGRRSCKVVVERWVGSDHQQGEYYHQVFDLRVEEYSQTDCNKLHDVYEAGYHAAVMELAAGEKSTNPYPKVTQ